MAEGEPLLGNTINTTILLHPLLLSLPAGNSWPGLFWVASPSCIYAWILSETCFVKALSPLEPCYKQNLLWLNMIFFNCYVRDEINDIKTKIKGPGQVYKVVTRDWKTQVKSE